MKMLGLNPLEQEVLDLTNEVARNGFIFFPEFCSIVHRKYREEDEHFFTRSDFFHIMRNLPEEVTNYFQTKLKISYPPCCR